MIFETPFGFVMITTLYKPGGDVTDRLDEACQYVALVVDGPNQGRSLTGEVKPGAEPVALN